MALTKISQKEKKQRCSSALFCSILFLSDVTNYAAKKKELNYTQTPDLHAPSRRKLHCTHAYMAVNIIPNFIPLALIIVLTSIVKMLDASKIPPPQGKARQGKS
jgi:hypothetical protein